MPSNLLVSPRSGPSLPHRLLTLLRRPWLYRPPTARTQQADRLALLLLALPVLALGLGLRDPWPADEPRFVLIAEEMLATGQWLFPHRAGELYPDKPPLFFWALVLSDQLLGAPRIAFLLPSLLAGLGVLFLVYDLGRRLWHRRAGLGAALTLLLLVPQFPLQVRTAQIDSCVTFLITLGLYGLCRHLLLGPHWCWLATGGLAMGLGIATKGVGFLPLLTLFPWLWGKVRAYRGLSHVRGPRWFVLPLALVLGVSLWLGPMLASAAGNPDLEAYRNEILWGQTAERYADMKGGHSRPLLYYPLQVVPTLWMPIALLLPWLLPAWRRRLVRGDARYLLLLGFVALVMLFFTFSSAKRGVYLLPAAPAIALATGPLLAGLSRKRGPNRVAFALLFLLTALVSLLGLAGLTGLPQALEAAAKEGIEPFGLLLTLGLGGLLALTLKPQRGLQGLAAFLALLFALYGAWAYPLLDPKRSSNRFMAEVASHLATGEDLAMVGWKEQLMLHAERPVTHWGFMPDHLAGVQGPAQERHAALWLQSEGHRALLLSDRHLEPCFVAEKGLNLGQRHRREWFLLRADAISPACPAPEGEGRSYRSVTTRFATTP